MICCCIALGKVPVERPGSEPRSCRARVTPEPPIVMTPSGPAKRNRCPSPPPPSAKFTLSINVKAGCDAVFG